jgi:hypothetical protein
MTMNCTKMMSQDTIYETQQNHNNLYDANIILF